MDNFLHHADPEAGAEAGVQFGASDAFFSAMSSNGAGNHVHNTTPSLTEAILDPDLFLVNRFSFSAKAQ